MSDDLHWAHVRIDPETGQPVPQLLHDHLLGVAGRAAEFAAPFGGDWARLAGLWHDLGKYRPGFGKYIRQANAVDAHIEGRVKDRDKTHSAAGAVWAERLLSERYGAQGRMMARALQYAIAGHHAGLDNWDGGLAARLASGDAQRECDEALVAAVPLPQDGEKRFEIYVREKAILNLQHQRAYSALKLDAAVEEPDADSPDSASGKKKPARDKRKGSGDEVDRARRWMCQNFYDVRTFGAVMSTGINCGQVRGPVQLTFARSIDPIVAAEHAITRMAVATEAEAEKQQGDNRTMGRKHTVPYGLYRAHGFVSAFLAKQTGFGGDDLELLWQSLEQMFEQDRSAARGQMSTRGLYVFEHASELGNAHAHELFGRISVNKKSDVPRGFDDYEIRVDAQNMPANVQLLRKVGD